ncbi:sensor histidine kinase [Eubacterium oxidoreducens]|uniref:GHKL domain-containing protein n=1 Tax=Eubacterium oxidoreducens TaxID=1732 RepID=A0A1G6BQV8_EUBOX|nr:GHKL domain-containing protein [Eubacterium oxidoreducens]SDB22998.1 GHKL domain-containing protein [Eubacterium oxidoreducens]
MTNSRLRKMFLYLMVLAIIVQTLPIIFYFVYLETDYYIAFTTPFTTLVGLCVFCVLIALNLGVMKDYKKNKNVRVRWICGVLLMASLGVWCVSLMPGYRFFFLQEGANISLRLEIITMAFLIVGGIALGIELYFIYKKSYDVVILSIMLAYEWLLAVLLNTLRNLGTETTSYLRDSFLYLLPMIASVVAYLLWLFAKKYHISVNKNASRKLWKEYYEQQKDYFNKISLQDRNTKKFRHDMTNHLIAISDFVDKGMNEEAHVYLADLMKEIKEISDSQYDVGNEIINVLINYYLVFENKKPQIQVIGKIGEIESIKKKDLCVIFANLLKNARDAVCELEEDGKIYIELKRGRDFASFEIENSANISMQRIKEMKNGIYKTTQEDTQLHGYGLSNVKHVLQKIGGEIRISVKEASFQVLVMIPVGDKIC